ncbi:hypothetical protein JFK97_10950 [Chromobacterium phragmitis]|uniref:phage tail assembly chaperone n=1 Tax=Chromobacterium amazonense TaxID=1382803 RepID=UPI0021B843B7|nr:phage tail assembly chaperone [Chromobacterium amazonense]MBM2884905.1 hypothetical protein [Chromobacterium amazonense]MDE1714748.1 phage tail assembly chaperone [Chromobacterium amazonense]
MAFVVKQNPTIRWPIKVQLLADGGLTDKHEFLGVFNRLPPEQVVALAQEGVSDEASFPQLLQANVDKFARLLVGWEGVTDADGQPLPFSLDLLRQLVTGPDGAAFSRGIWEAINELTYGAREKN